MRSRFPSRQGLGGLAWTLVAALSLGACGEEKSDDADIQDSTGGETVGDTKGDGLGEAGSDAGDGWDGGANGSDAAVGPGCAGHGDCKQVGAFCVEGACGAPQPCASDKVCLVLGGVCSPALGVCVECAADSDCAADQSCQAHRCQAAPLPCQSSKDCAAFGKVCDKAASGCVGCAVVEDCGAGEQCLQGSCVLPVCGAGAASCVDASTSRACKADGMGYALTACGDGALCKAGTCAALVCTPAAKRCDPAGGGVQTCGDDGTAWGAATACGAGSVCIDGACKAAVCAPGAGACFGATASTCNDDGSAWVEAPCGAGTSCAVEGGKAACKPHVCAPGTKQCNGAKIEICEGNGLSWAPHDSCDGPGPDGGKQVCAGGACQPATCSVGATSCGPGGALLTCGAGGTWEVGSCGAGKICLGSGCVTQSCAPGAKSCGGALVLICNGSGTDQELGPECDKLGDACGPGVCKEGACAIAQKSCDDGNACTSDGCDGKVGCTHKAVDAVGCGEGKTCIAGVCKDQVCKPGATICQGQVVAVCNANGTGYDVGQDCVAGGGKCGSGVCKEGVCSVQSAGCDDGNGCTLDGCDAVSGCTHKVIEGACDDGDGCSVGESCDAGVCKGATPKACTVDSCKAGVCQAPELTSISMAYNPDVGGAPVACVTSKAGKVYCWGGQTALIPETDASKVVEIKGIDDAVEVKLGNHDFACARRVGGGVRCWGNNDVGQLGVPPETLKKSIGVAVDSPELGKLKAVSIGLKKSTAYAVEGAPPKSKVWGWGSNTWGEFCSKAVASAWKPVAIQVKPPTVQDLSGLILDPCAKTPQPVRARGSTLTKNRAIIKA